MRKLAFLVAVLVPACTPAYKPVKRAVAVRDINTVERTRMTSRFIWNDGMLEATVPGQSPELVTDIAVLGQRPDGVICVHLVMRTGAKHDAPFGEWNPKINGEPVFPEHEMFTQDAVQVASERTLLDASVFTNTAIGALTITQPSTDEYPIIRREAWFCPAQPLATNTLEMRLTREFPYGKANEGYIWTLMR
ncbi:MAG TPA: hypothetical protein VIV11_16145 [Kofleriaceae bacterium]